jgi:trehalose/maltose hydrolase-like predicted phosphorylase
VSDPGRHGGGWELWYQGFDPHHEGHREAFCTLGNGYMATRGAACEAVADEVHYPGTYVAGLYNRLASQVAGRQVEHESIVNLPNWLPLSFRPTDGVWLAPGSVELLDHRRLLDLRRGVLLRHSRVRDAAGRITTVEERRLVSMASPHIAALQQTITPENWSGQLELRGWIDGDVANTNTAEDRLLANRHLRVVGRGKSDLHTVWLEAETTWSSVRVAQAVRLRVAGSQGDPVVSMGDDSVALTHVLDVVTGRPVTVEKVAALYTSRDPAVGDPLASALISLGDAGGFEELLAAHQLAWRQLWQRCRLELDPTGSDQELLVLRLHVFHLLQTLSPHVADVDAGVPARGLHGEGYRGRVFWDELFVFPLLNLRLPELTRALLRYRSRRLPAARRQARELGQGGARFPWQSASDGTEQTPSQLYNPRSARWIPDNSRRQHHVGLAVAYNVWQYYQATGDLSFLRERGAELLVEIARFWTGLAEHDPADNRYHIRGIMGPDEYHDGYPERPGQGIDNNTYTNVLVSWLLQRTIEARGLLDAHQQDRQLWERLAVADEELIRWERVASRLRVPFHDGIPSQFDGWERLDELDWDAYRRRYGNIGRLYLILEAEGDTTNRYQLSKQADVLMLLYLFSADELEGLLDHLGYRLDRAAIPSMVTYYLARTAHGSTLSRLVHAWVLARSNRARSWPLFSEALVADLDDTQGGTTREGIHLGAMAGSVDLVQRCYSGLELRADTLWLAPHLPDELPLLAFDALYRGHSLAVTITHDQLSVTAQPCAANPISIGLAGQVSELAAGQTLRVPLNR